MVQQVKALAAKPKGQSSVPGTQMAEGKNQLQQVVFQTPHAHVHIYMCPHIHTCKNEHIKNQECKEKEKQKCEVR